MLLQVRQGHRAPHEHQIGDVQMFVVSRGPGFCPHGHHVLVSAEWVLVTFWPGQQAPISMSLD